jgi:hypothetical protein
MVGAPGLDPETRCQHEPVTRMSEEGPIIRERLHRGDHRLDHAPVFHEREPDLGDGVDDRVKRADSTAGPQNVPQPSDQHAGRLRRRAALPIRRRADVVEPSLRARDYSAALIVRRSDPGDVASGAYHRGDRHRRQPVGALEGGRHGERAAASERGDLRLRRRAGSQLAHGHYLATAGDCSGSEGDEFALNIRGRRL